MKTAVKIVKNEGVTKLYSGLTASLMRQLTYSTTRFGIYEITKQALVKPGDNTKLSFATLVSMAAVAGGAGGIVGTPADMVNVRMQNDVKLPKEQRRK